MRPVLWTVLAALIPVTLSSQGSKTADGARPLTASVVGSVVTEQNAQPIRRAVVTLRGASVPERKTLTTADGHFRFTNLPAGRFTVIASKAGYVDAGYGAFDRPSGPPIALADGATIEITIPLPYGAIIGGTITSSSGEPVPGVHVTALRMSSTSELSRVSQAETDDRGIYRMFGLVSGNYVVAATMPPLSSFLLTRGGAVERPSGADVEAALMALRETPGTNPSNGMRAPHVPNIGLDTVAFVPVYFPGVPSSQDAIPIRLATGQEHLGIDFVFEPAATVSVSGRVIGSALNVNNAQIALQSRGSSAAGSSTYRTASPRSDGGFSFTGVAPGRYKIEARANPNPKRASDSRTVSTAASASASNSETDFLYATVEIEVGSADVAGVQLVLEPGGILTGQLRFLGPPVRDVKLLAQIRVTLSPAGTTMAQPSIISREGFSTAREARLRADSTFSIRGIAPGTYAMRVLFPSQIGSRWVQSALVAGRDLLDEDLEFSTGVTVNNVVVTISPHAQALSGKVRTANGNPASEHTVVIFSANRSYWNLTSRRTRIARVDTDGVFEFADLAAGAYLVAALRVDEIAEAFNSSSFEQLAEIATPVTIRDGEQQVLSLQLAQ